MPKRETDNLKSIRSVDEAREKGKKGGIASGESRRKKKELRKELEELLSLPVKSAKMLKDLQSAGIPAESGTTLQTAITAAMIKQAANGNVRAFQAIAELMTPKSGKKENEGETRKIEFIFKDTSMKVKDDESKSDNNT